MNIFSITCLLASFFAIENAVSVFRLNRRSPVNITFSLFTLSFAASCFCMGNGTSVSTYALTRFWYKMNIPFGIFLPGLALHFSMFLAGKRKLAMHPVTLGLIYLLPFFFIYKMLFSGYFEADFKLTAWGWDSVIDYTVGYNWIFGMLYSVPVSLSTFYIFSWQRKLKNKEEAAQASALVFPYLSGMLAIIINPHFWYIKESEDLNFLLNMLSIFAFLVFLIGTRRAVNKFNFMKIRAESRVDALISGLMEPAMLTDLECNVICYNIPAHRILKYLGKSKISNIFDVEGISESLIESVRGLVENKNSTGEVIFRDFINKEDNRSYSIVIKKFSIKEKYSAGMLWFLKENQSAVSMIHKFGLTERQMDIIRIVLSGCSNKEIAAKLGIAERTVENHLFNIYNKIGVTNRIELFNIAVRYGIIPG